MAPWILSGTIRVSQSQKGKTNLDFTEGRHSEWQRHQLGHMWTGTGVYIWLYACEHVVLASRRQSNQYVHIRTKSINIFNRNSFVRNHWVQLVDQFDEGVWQRQPSSSHAASHPCHRAELAVDASAPWSTAPSSPCVDWQWHTLAGQHSTQSQMHQPTIQTATLEALQTFFPANLLAPG